MEFGGHENELLSECMQQKRREGKQKFAIAKITENEECPHTWYQR